MYPVDSRQGEETSNDVEVSVFGIFFDKVPNGNNIVLFIQFLLIVDYHYLISFNRKTMP